MNKKKNTKLHKFFFCMLILGVIVFVVGATAIYFGSVAGERIDECSVVTVGAESSAFSLDPIDLTWNLDDSFSFELDPFFVSEDEYTLEVVILVQNSTAGIYRLSLTSNVVSNLYVAVYYSSLDDSSGIIFDSTSSYLYFASAEPFSIYIYSIPGFSSTDEIQISFLLEDSDYLDSLLDGIISDAYSGGYEFGHGLGYESGYEAGYAQGEQDGLNESQEASYNQGYQAGFEAGEEQGYDEGYAQGKLVGIEIGEVQGYQSGLAVGKEQGYDEGYAQGKQDGLSESQSGSYNQGYQAGLAAGKEQGYDEGYSQGNLDGFGAGQQEGYEDGYSQGLSVGVTAGYQSGYDIGYQTGLNESQGGSWQEGYDEGHNDGYQDGYADGHAQGVKEGGVLVGAEAYDSGYSAGYQEGHLVGYSEGLELAEKGDFLSLFTSIIDAPISSFTSLLDFEIFGYNIKSLVLALLSVALVIAALKTFMGMGL